MKSLLGRMNSQNLAHLALDEREVLRLHGRPVHRDDQEALVEHDLLVYQLHELEHALEIVLRVQVLEPLYYDRSLLALLEELAYSGCQVGEVVGRYVLGLRRLRRPILPLSLGPPARFRAA